MLPKVVLYRRRRTPRSWRALRGGDEAGRQILQGQEGQRHDRGREHGLRRLVLEVSLHVGRHGSDERDEVMERKDNQDRAAHDRLPARFLRGRRAFRPLRRASIRGGRSLPPGAAPARGSAAGGAPRRRHAGGLRAGSFRLFAGEARASRKAGSEIGSLGPMGRLPIRGKHGHDIIDALSPVTARSWWTGELRRVLRHERWSALRARGIDTLVFGGVTADVCVHTTLREAYDRWFRCSYVADAISCFDPEIRRACEKMIEEEGGIWGTLTSVDEATTGRSRRGLSSFVTSCESVGVPQRMDSHAAPRAPTGPRGCASLWQAETFNRGSPSERPLASTSADSSWAVAGSRPGVRRPATALPRAASRHAPSRCRAGPWPEQHPWPPRRPATPKSAVPSSADRCTQGRGGASGS